MTRLLEEIHRIDDSAKRIMTEGIVKYAMGFYMNVRKKDINNYKEIIGKITDYFKLMDRKFYDELEGKPEDMKDLTKFLNEKGI